VIILNGVKHFGRLSSKNLREAEKEPFFRLGKDEDTGEPGTSRSTQISDFGNFF
jgi:hypothetical protein